jgi:membrane protease YdiL (CAAX protease family)
MNPQSKLSSLAALAGLVPAPTLGILAATYWWPDSALGQALFFASKVWLAAFPTTWLLFVEHGKLSWSPPRRGGFAFSAILGLALAAVILAAYSLVAHMGWIDRQGVARLAARTGLNHFPVYLGGAIYWITLNSLMEEYVWRWFVFRHFEVLLGGRLAVIASALGFTLHHVVALQAQFSWGITAAAALGVFAGGTIWSALYLRCRSIWPCYLSHAIVDMPIFLIGYWLIFRTA